MVTIRVFGIETYGFSECTLGGFELFAGFECGTQEAMRFCEFGFELDSLSCPLLGVGVFVLLKETGGQIDVHRHVGRIEADRELESGLGLGHSLEVSESHAEITVGIGVLGVKPESVAEVWFRIGRFAFPDQFAPSLVVPLGFRIAALGRSRGGWVYRPSPDW